MNEEDTFRSEDKVIQFINIGLSNAELSTKMPKPLIIDSIQAKTPKPLTADSNQVEPFTNTSEAELFTTILKCLITTLMIKDDFESSETTSPIKQGLIFISWLNKSQGPHYISSQDIHVEISDSSQQLSTFKQKVNEAELQTLSTDKQHLINQLKNHVTREKSSNVKKVSAPQSVINIIFLKALVLMILNITARLNTQVQEQAESLQWIQRHMTEVIMNLNGLKKSVNATLIYTEETQNTLTNLVNILRDLIEHLKVLRRTANTVKLKVIENGWKALNIEAERYLIVWKKKEVDQDDKHWDNAFFEGWQFVIVILVICHLSSIHLSYIVLFFLLTFLSFAFFSFAHLTWHNTS